MRFVGNFILSSSCEFYDDDVTVMSFINFKDRNVAPVMNSVLLWYFCRQKKI